MQISTTEYFFLAVFILLLIISFVCSRAYRSLSKQTTDGISETRNELKTYRNVFSFFSLFVPLIYLGYYFTSKYHLESHVMEWLNLIIRWAHVMFGIAWI